MSKGSDFEREICKRLSRWWTAGERDDVFWRSSQSGGRATLRTRKGQTTFGSYGDITAVDPIGQPLLRVFTIELKRGRSHGTPEDLVDLPETAAIRPFEQTLRQTISSSEDAGTPYWMLISRRDRRQTMVYLPWNIINVLGGVRTNETLFHRVSYIIPDRRFKKRGKRIKFLGIRFEAFLSRVTPDSIARL